MDYKKAKEKNNRRDGCGEKQKRQGVLYLTVCLLDSII